MIPIASPTHSSADIIFQPADSTLKSETNYKTKSNSTKNTLTFHVNPHISSSTK
jgi:hypothetical protein